MPTNIMPEFALRENETTTVMIDGAGLHYAARNLNLEFDFARLRSYFKRYCNLRRIIYYTVLQIEEDAHGNEKYNPIKPLVTFLSTNGFNTVVNEKFIDAGLDFNKKPAMGNMMPQMSADIMRHASDNDHIIIFSGNGDLAYAVDSAKTRFGTKFTACALIRSPTPTMADELRRAVDQAFCLGNADIQGIVRKIPRNANDRGGEDIPYELGSTTGEARQGKLVST